MGNFEEMFERLTGESEQRKRDREEKEREQREASDAAFAKARDQLVHNVLPVLQEAQAKFTARGVPTHISDNWSHIGRPMLPELEFKCEDDYRPNKIGGKYKPQGRSAFFSIRDGVFQVGLGKYGGAKFADEKLRGSDEEMIQKAIEEALASYLRAVEEGERHF